MLTAVNCLHNAISRTKVSKIQSKCITAIAVTPDGINGMEYASVASQSSKHTRLILLHICSSSGSCLENEISLRFGSYFPTNYKKVKYHCML